MPDDREAGQILLRRARAGDASDLARLSGQLGYPSTRAQVRRRLRRLLRDRRSAVMVAEARGGGVAGWVHVYLCELLEVDPQVELGGLVVDGRFRGRGAGRLLLRRAEAWARARSCRVLCVRTNVVRRRAHRFYERLGYRLLKTQRVYRRPLAPPRRSRKRARETASASGRALSGARAALRRRAARG